MRKPGRRRTRLRYCATTHVAERRLSRTPPGAIAWSSSSRRETDNGRPPYVPSSSPPRQPVTGPRRRYTTSPRVTTSLRGLPAPPFATSPPPLNDAHPPILPEVPGDREAPP